MNLVKCKEEEEKVSVKLVFGHHVLMTTKKLTTRETQHVCNGNSYIPHCHFYDHYRYCLVYFLCRSRVCYCPVSVISSRRAEVRLDKKKFLAYELLEK